MEGGARTLLALTMGDPAGIGPEITTAAWRALRAGGGPAFVVPGDAALLAAHAPVRIVADVAQAAAAFTDAIPVLAVDLPGPVQPGRPDPANAPAITGSIDCAVALALAGQVGGVVTNPISKLVLKRAGFRHPGHTEYLAELCAVPGQEVMMLACPELRVVPVTIHMALRRALDSLTTAEIVRCGRTAAAALRRDFGIAAPRVAVAGLNPHAGEGGVMGDEERTIIAPALDALRADGIAVSGPWPPDTMFTPLVRARYDVALCMYHDQALIPLKTIDMAGGVNVTLGLPIIRTSPDHGTAFDIAGQGLADPSSLLAALRLADEMTRNRRAA
ncbi:4-hydroxythreonine-4-phosphate dehydrogenase PdxA [Gluconacetobacter diazotrophicus]|uniref:4-hydroxythreonine-4-phosphate dehydrogenase n=1 Tax=Gluconacetobacter diazotrophicus (strain ATCC 49037 / DSM 5601 / CCUG 37298 / CIP 103539 / LMG 7603 / PAl5) TaxID=272568 RepID=A9HET4_GLUDA|nr:4-hydroxythreonine-4-phosphate dehydrogenase PdxA [Gluconacetobacter diazotrophicus]TWB11144.1 4-hydroxythreonine-4-phosphate dehydrogenase [Gluconacetobacter diazotrophicus]CAP55276.1 putative 4-hydroxythreonine-4-phosphate dehydrogenase [Gluconacetobacter diazotrophicus PA1 5]